MHAITRSCKTKGVCQNLEEREVPGKGNVSYIIITTPWVNPWAGLWPKHLGKRGVMKDESQMKRRVGQGREAMVARGANNSCAGAQSGSFSRSLCVCEVSRPLEALLQWTNEQIKAFRTGTFRTTSYHGPGRKEWLLHPVWDYKPLIPQIKVI